MKVSDVFPGRGKFREDLLTYKRRRAVMNTVLASNERLLERCFRQRDRLFPELEQHEDPGKNAFVDRHNGLPEEIVRPEQVNALPFQLVDEPAQRRRIAGYYNSIKRMDIQLGVVVQVLRQHGRLDDSAVVFTSDQGPAFTRSKTTVYEATVKVPLYLRAPGAAGGGAQVAEFASHIDIAPTFLALAKPAGPALPGFDLRAIAVGETRRRFLFTEANYHFPCRFFPQRGVRSQRYKLIENLGVGVLDYSASSGVRSIDADRS